MKSLTERSLWIKNKARELGFSFCGISQADFLEKEAPLLEKWLKEGKHGKMSYMENHFDKRLDPRKLVDGARSVVSLMYNYFTEEKQLPADAPKISKYAYGEDYHFVVKEKLNQLLDEIRQTIGAVNGRVFVDSAPVLERAWAVQSGLGWIGKNSNLINKQQGSFFFLSELIIDLELQADPSYEMNYCGTCTACIDACPTQAIAKEGGVDGSKCISYFTIELKEEIPDSYKGKFDKWMFGCDICQDICPWNRFSQSHLEKRFLPSEEFIHMDLKEWQNLSKEAFQRIFPKSAVKRTGYNGLKRNIVYLKET